ncbi:EamA family transporter [Candidatus Marsarchaeota archaeon]|nr:EamA family transporter [Candidatus Marsarchaeota archaeon]
MKIRISGYLMLLAAIITTASTPILYKLGSTISFIELAFMISLVGTIISLFVVLLRHTWKQVVERFSNAKQFLHVASFGILTYVLITIIFSYSTHYVSADLTAIIYRTWPLMVVALAPIMMREKINRYDIAGVAIGFSSLLIAIGAGSGIGIPIAALPFVLILLLSALFDAVASAISKRYNYEITSSLFIYNFVALVIFLPVAVLTNSINTSSIGAYGWAAILLLGVVQNVLLTFFFVGSFRMVKTSIASNVYVLSPFITMVLGAAVLGEAILPYYLIIALGVLIGIVVQRSAPKTGNYIAEDKDEGKKLSIYDITGAFVNTRNSAIYNAMKGDGRVLAFYKKGVADAFEAALGGRFQSDGGEGGLVFTDKAHGGNVTGDELEFVRDIMGCNENDCIFIGAGNPKYIERRFYEINNRIENGKMPEIKSVQ